MPTMNRDGAEASAEADVGSGAAQALMLGANAESARPFAGNRGKPANSERIACRVSRLLATHVPALFCDDCITDKLGLSDRRQANRVTVVFGKSASFWRDVGACSVCRKHKQVIRHV